MDGFFEQVNKIVASQGGDPKAWSKEYQKHLDKLHSMAFDFAKKRFNEGYEMGKRHGIEEQELKQ